MSRATAGLVSRPLLLPRLLTGAQRAESSPPRPFSNALIIIRVVGTREQASTALSTEHTAKWMTDYELKAPQELIAEVHPIKVGATRVVACEGGRDLSLGHPVEYICLDLPEANPCKYRGLRYVQAQHNHHYL